MSELPTGVIRFEPRDSSYGVAGSLQRAVVMVNGLDVAELPVANVSYTQEAAHPGRWTLMLFADATDPLARTWGPK